MDDHIESYKIIIENRDYSSFKFFQMEEQKEVELSVCPIKNNLFNHDVFTISHDKTINTLHSIVRNSNNIPGVIILKDNKTYGRHKNKKLLYKCIPDDSRLPTFLVPYQIKNMGFSKNFVNLYITFSVHQWVDQNPHATIDNVIGPVDQLENYYEYQLYCKSLYASIQHFNKKTIKAINNSNHDDLIEQICLNNPTIEDRTDPIWNIFTIDPFSSLDYDDAFSIRAIDDDNMLLSIYISNVTLWIDILKLWDSFSKRISTIYLPDRKRPMLPTILSECLCSLLEKKLRIALVLDIFINKDFEVYNMKYTNAKIKVSKNFSYEEKALLQYYDYIQLLDITRQLSNKHKYVSSIRDSHDVVTYLMIFMNYHTAKLMFNNKIGILRSTIINKNIVIPSHLPDNVSKFIKIWNSSSGQYIDINTIKPNDVYNHDFLEMDAYLHITSPIRRIIDLLNIIQLQHFLNIGLLSKEAYAFYDVWISQLEYINTTMRYIRKVQNDCSLLHLCFQNPIVVNTEYEGFLFDKMERSDGLFHYIVFLPDLKLTSKITIRDDLNNFDKKLFKLFIFQDENNIKRKIRLQIIT